MDDHLQPGDSSLPGKIARLVRERGWNQEDFARIANLNRHTVRKILQDKLTRGLRNATVSSCARALGLTVSELRETPLDRLLPRMIMPQTGGNEHLRKLYEQATQPELRTWMEHHPDRASHLSSEELDELMSLQGTGGPLTAEGLEQHVALIERKRKLLEKLHIVAGSDYIDLLEQILTLLCDKVQPYRDRR